MISFLIHMLLLVRKLMHGLRNDPEFRAMAVLLVILLAGGTMFYWQVEHWSILDSLYFCVMTIATIGSAISFLPGNYPKCSPLAYAILGIGLFASFVGKLVALRMQHHARGKQKHDYDNEK